MAEEIKVGTIIHVSPDHQTAIKAMFEDIQILGCEIIDLMTQKRMKTDKVFDFLKGCYPESQGWRIRYFPESGNIILLEKEEKYKEEK